MAEFRERPYSQFNFLVDLGNGGTDSIQAGFQEVSGLGMEISMAEYRNGNEQDNAPRKITGMVKTPDITLKRGLIGSLDLYEWLDQIRNGQQDALRSVTIQLQDEAHTQVVQEWKLTNARPIKYTGPSLNGKGNDVAIEELTLACERVDIA